MLDRYDPKTERAAFTYYGIHFQTTAAKAGSQQAAEAHWAARSHIWSWNLDRLYTRNHKNARPWKDQWLAYTSPQESTLACEQSIGEQSIVLICINILTSLQALHGSSWHKTYAWHVPLRLCCSQVLARICWMQFEQKCCKEEVLSFRDKWYERLGTSKAKDRATSSKAAKVRNVAERPVKRTRPHANHWLWISGIMIQSCFWMVFYACLFRHVWVSWTFFAQLIMDWTWLCFDIESAFILGGIALTTTIGGSRRSNSWSAG